MVVPARSTRTSLTDENRPLGKKLKRPLGWRTAISSGTCLKGLIRRVRIRWERWIINIGMFGLKSCVFLVVGKASLSGGQKQRSEFRRLNKSLKGDCGEVLVGADQHLLGTRSRHRSCAGSQAFAVASRRSYQVSVFLNRPRSKSLSLILKPPYIVSLQRPGLDIRTLCQLCPGPDHPYPEHQRHPHRPSSSHPGPGGTDRRPGERKDH